MVSILNELFKTIEGFIVYIILANTIIIFILLVLYIGTRIKLNKLTLKYKKFMNGTEDKNIEDLIINSIDLSNSISLKNKEIENRINYIERNMQQCVQKTGVIRYNAFDNVGSDLSFAIALLDANDNGLVINGIYSRDSSSTYAKGIVAGKSKYPLSAEEIQAIDIAKKINK